MDTSIAFLVSVPVHVLYSAQYVNVIYNTIQVINIINNEQNFFAGKTHKQRVGWELTWPEEWCFQNYETDSVSTKLDTSLQVQRRSQRIRRNTFSL